MSGFQRDSFHVLFNLDEFRFSLRGLKILSVAFLGVHLVAGVVSPLFYKAVVLWNTVSPNSFNGWLVSRQFPEYYDRLRVLFFLLVIPWMLLQCRLLSVRKLGYRADFPWYTHFLRFYLGGAVSIVVVLTTLLGIGVIHFVEPLSVSSLVVGFLLAFLAAFFAGSIEELIFRSLFFRMFYTAFTPVLSVVLSSLFFAYMHFKEPEGLWDYSTAPTDVVFSDGLWMGFWVVTGIFTNFSLVLFLNYTLVGYLMTVVFMKTRSLWASIGLHAGWVTPLLWFRNMGALSSDSSSLWWGSYELVDGYFCTLLLLIFAVFLTRVYKPARPTGFSF